MKDLADRLKEAEARLPAALTTAYRHVLVPAEKKTLRCFDMGIAVQGKASLSQRVLDKLEDEQQILDKLDPAILIGERFGLWPDDQEMINVRTLADYFTQLTHLPMLLGSSVLPDCLAKGVQRGLFAYALGDGEKKEFDTIRFNDPDGHRRPLRDHGLGLAAAARPGEVACCPRRSPRQSARRLAGARRWAWVASGATRRSQATRTTGTAAVAVKIVKGERRLNRVRIQMRSPWENWNDIYNEVIDPLAQEGADLLCDLTIVAKGDAAIRENTVELGIKESLSQRGLKANIETG